MTNIVMGLFIVNAKSLFTLPFSKQQVLASDVIIKVNTLMSFTIPAHSRLGYQKLIGWVKDPGGEALCKSMKGDQL